MQQASDGSYFIPRDSAGTPPFSYKYGNVIKP
jgi:hypothetical protein